MKPVIIVKNLTKSFSRNLLALDDVSLKLETKFQYFV